MIKRSMTGKKSFVKLVATEIRLTHWIKNLLVFAPLFFAHQLFAREIFWPTAKLFLAFSFLASAVYIINDLFDKKNDAHHAAKKNRPLAASTLSITAASVTLIVSLLLATILVWQFNNSTQITLLIYFILNILYSKWLKNIPVLDIFIIAAFYLLRIIAGGLATNIFISEWIMVVTFFLALFLILGKRRAEFYAVRDNHTAQIDHNPTISSRNVLAAYDARFLDHTLAIVITGTIISYTLYTVNTQIPFLLYSSFFVFFGMFRYLFIIYKFNRGEIPEKLILGDPWLLGTVIGWLSYCYIIFYV